MCLDLQIWPFCVPDDNNNDNTTDYFAPTHACGVITILSNINKVLEKFLMPKILQQDSLPTLNPLQGGFESI